MKRLKTIGKVIWITSFLLIVTIASASAKMQQTEWRPDTCDNCVIIYEWDDTVSQELRVHTAVSVTNSHPDFANDTKEIQYQKILEENQRKNIALGEIKKQIPTIDETQIKFSYDKFHKLHLIIDGLTVSEKTLLKGKIDAKIGVDKVIIE